MRVLLACECSGTVRDAFLAKGHDAMSADMKPTETPGPHYYGDVMAMDCDFGRPSDIRVVPKPASIFERRP